MNTEKTDILIIGAGVVGLAVAAEITARRRPGLDVVLMERHERFGLETSSRNSEVIHAGIYYPQGSLKALLCVEGKRLLYEYCSRFAIPHRRCGKLIVANTPEEIDSLGDLFDRAVANGVEDLEELNAAQVARFEPHIRAERALFSPSTGVIDSHRLMACLEQNARQKGALIAYRHLVTAIEPRAEGLRVHFRNPDGSLDVLDCGTLINSAGLQADRVAALAGIDPERAGYRQHLCKGEYFSLPPAKASLVSRPVYPPPLHELTGLGIHATKTLDDRLRLGPNTVYIEEEDYSVDEKHAEAFYQAASTFMPFITREDLAPEMAGIRPKLSAAGEPFRDFIITTEKDRGLHGLVNLIGIESPGLTASLAIARRVCDLL